MGAICGIVRRDGAPLEAWQRDALPEAVAEWARGGFGEWCNGCALLGQARTFSTLEARLEALPVWDPAGGFAFTAAARLDNREELIRLLSLPVGEGGSISDGGLVLGMYRRFGQDAPGRLFGDWCFAAWHPRERRLFLARDHFGNTALYYYANDRLLAFGPSPQALLAVAKVPLELDELKLAQYLVPGTAQDGQRTICAAIRHVPPAHTLTLTPERLQTRRYWQMGDVSELGLRRRSDYVEAFGDRFVEAVRVRLRAGADVGVTLSGGLDSGSVAVTAARLLGAEGRRLLAFTSVPMADTTAYAGERFGDELPLARMTAEAAENIDLRSVACEGVSPIAAIRQGLAIFGVPVHAAGSMFWLNGLCAQARAHDCGVLLTGQLGNMGISWTGDPLSQPLAYQLRRLGAGGLIKARLRRVLPRRLRAARARARLDPDWYRSSAVHPDFVRRLNLAELRLQDRNAYLSSPRERRLAVLDPGRSVGAIFAAQGAHFGLDIRDPTGDARLLSFALSVPDWVFTDPETGSDRWLIRESMRDRLPDEVRLNRRRGRQAGDLVPRLRRCTPEVESALDELAAGAATAYLDVEYMRQVWSVVQRDDTPDALRKAVTVLTRGIMGGLYVNALSRGTLS